MIYFMQEDPVAGADNCRGQVPIGHYFRDLLQVPLGVNDISRAEVSHLPGVFSK